MNHLIRLVLLFFITISAYAQVPQQFSFQGVARDEAGKIISNRNISLRISVRPTTALGSPVFQETHATQTSANGIFNISVGAGLVQSGQISGIKWDSDKFFLQVELDPDGGSNYVNLGATQLLSVPYALHAEEAGRWKNFDPVVQKGNIFQGSGLPIQQGDEFTSSTDTYLVWHPGKGAFRIGSGYKSVGVFEDANIGIRSLGVGINMIAKGNNSIALGDGARALENNSVAIGEEASATGENAISIGDNISSGYGSISIGQGLRSRSTYGTVLGLYNDLTDAVGDQLLPTSRIFQIGNGDYQNSKRSNALTILYNGNVEIGNNALLPTYILDVGGRMRLRSNIGSTAGLWLNDAGGAQYCFIGGVNDSEAGFYFENAKAWRFNVYNNGSAWLAGTLTQNSDLRLKHELQPLSGSLNKLTSLNGFHYLWKDKSRSQSLQTGLIAQEVEDVFPELVETNKDGYKSVNYIGFIPHLLEAVKELKEQNKELAATNDRLEAHLTTVEAQAANKEGEVQEGSTKLDLPVAIALLLFLMCVAKIKI
ncbi:tail fiber domain-containing protein [Dyadobacter sp.]|uniref:tail fiber domain-containing protein n=1 Tax=Dyadobacter sp. TaxID=1914288 RepID=UPI003F71184B